MANDLTVGPSPVVTSEAAKSSISAQQVAQPYTELATVLDKTAGTLNDIAIPFAERAGYEAVTRDENGNIQIATAPIIGPAAAAFERATKVAAVAAAETDAQRDDIDMRAKFQNDPQGYRAAANAYRTDRVAQLTKSLGPEIATTVGRAIDQTQTTTYSGLSTQATATQLRADDAAITARIESAKDDAVAMARGGDTSSPAYQHALDTVRVLTDERVRNPALAYPREKADYDLQNFQSTMQANAFLHQIDSVYNDKGVGPNGEALGGKAKALEAAQRLRTDPNLKLSEAQREAYFHKANAEINANEAQRTAALSDARASSQELNLASAAGLKIEPADVDRVASAFRAAGAPGDAARVYASFIRKPLNDDFGKMPLAAQTRDIALAQSSGKLKTFMEFFMARGLSLEAVSGMAGNTVHESPGLNPSAVGDGGTSLGIAQFHNERLTALRAFAKERGTSPEDFRTQLEFIDHELNTTESRVKAKLMAAKTPEEAAHAFIDYERPAGWTPENPAGGMGYASRIAIARKAYDMARGAGDGSAIGGGPATSAWLLANRKRTLDSAAETQWQAVQKTWNTSQIRPADAVVNQIVDAARLSGNSALLDVVAADVSKMDRVQAAGRDSLPVQSARIDEMSRRGSLGQLSYADAVENKEKEQVRDAIQKGLDSDPIATTVNKFGDRFSAPAPLDLSSDDALVGGLKARATIATFAAQNWQVPARSALDTADVQQMQAALASPDAATKVRLFRALATLPEDIRGATLAKLGSKGVVASTEVFAGSLITADADVAAGILTGLHAADVDKRLVPNSDAAASSYKAAKDAVLPMAAFTLPARSNPTGALAVMSNAIDARYASLSAQAGDTSGSLDRSRLRKAAEDVTGGVLYHGGAPLIAPARGMDQSKFDGIMAGITDKDLTGATTSNGAAVTADYLRDRAKLHSLATGRYLVQLNADTENPRYARGPDGGPFVLDLRGRAPAAIAAPTPTAYP